MSEAPLPRAAVHALRYTYAVCSTSSHVIAINVLHYCMLYCSKFTTTQSDECFAAVV